MARKPTGRPPGAPLNNLNHFKYGIYSDHISAVDDERLDQMPQDQATNELALVRSRIKMCLDMQGSIVPQERLALEKAISHYVGQVITMVHKNFLFGRDNKEALMTVMDFIHEANEVQHVL